MEYNLCRFGLFVDDIIYGQSTKNVIDQNQRQENVFVQAGHGHRLELATRLVRPVVDTLRQTKKQTRCKQFSAQRARVGVPLLAGWPGEYPRWTGGTPYFL
jgi:hypothetical protein